MWNQYLLMYFFILSVYAWTKKEYFKLEWFPTNKLWRPKDKVSNPVWYPFSKLDAHRNVWEKISQSLPTKDANSATWYGGDNHCTMGNHNCDKCPKIKLMATWVKNVLFIDFAWQNIWVKHIFVRYETEKRPKCH